MSSKKILVVFGATGGQGGSVIKSILGDPKTAAEYQIRAVTRDPSKPAGLALKEKGCEVVAVSLIFGGAFALLRRSQLRYGIGMK